MSEVMGLTGEQIAWLQVVREIDDRVLQIFSEGGAPSFTGKIVIELHCKDSVVNTYHVNVNRVYKPGEERRTNERRTEGHRSEPDRRKG